MEESLQAHLYKLREEVKLTSDLVRQELVVKEDVKDLRDASVRHDYAINDILRRLSIIEKRTEKIIKVSKDEDESKQNLKTILSSPVVIIGIIAIALIVMVIELVNKDTGGIVNPALKYHYEQKN